MLPDAIAREVATRLGSGDFHPPTEQPRPGGDCEGSKYHSPRPLVTYLVATALGELRLCGNCRDNLRLLENLQDEDEPLPWDALREFGNTIRDIFWGRTRD